MKNGSLVLLCVTGGIMGSLLAVALLDLWGPVSFDAAAIKGALAGAGLLALVCLTAAAILWRRDV